ncbi:pectinesterase family protein [Saccharicrinis sp. FJH54]|uniref:pectinesterase family protein n=1 Tax=Saccharicrinis sp. FJH54 TaxID=3344665 RepID=UPI0035D4A350
MKKNLTFILILFLFTTVVKAQDQLYNEIADKVTLVVARDGSGHFDQVQAAIDSIKKAATPDAVIYVKNGVYEGKISVNSTVKNLTIIGQDVDHTILTAQPTHGDGGFGTASVKIASEDFLALNLTIENSYGVGNQAEALATATKDRQQFAHCRFIGFQDTYYSGTPYRNYFKDCLIIGAVDYIFGNSTVIFDSCQIHNLRDRSWITAASTSSRSRFGYVFQNCWVTSEYGVKDVYFGRPWKDYPKVMFMNCYLSDCISPLGWDNTWYNPDDIGNVQFYEYNNYGPGSATDARISYSKRLTEEEAGVYVMDTVFGTNNYPALIKTEWSPDVAENPLYIAVKKYFKAFLDEEVTTAGLSALKLNGEDVPGFDPASEEITLTLPSGTTEWPVLEAVPVSSDMEVKIIYPQEIPGAATVVVSSKYKATHKAYTVNIQNDQTINLEIPYEIKPIMLNQNIGDCYTSIDALSLNDGLSLYPNPAEGTFNISMEHYTDKESVTVRVYNYMGQCIYDKMFAADKIRLVNRIDLSDFPAGQYLVNVYAEHKKYSTKVILK